MKLENLTAGQLAEKTQKILQDEKDGIYEAAHGSETAGKLKQEKAIEEKNRIQTLCIIA